jgi:hypothetical protein
MPATSTSGTSRSTSTASRRRSATIARSSGRTCCRPSAPSGSRTSRQSASRRGRPVRRSATGPRPRSSPCSTACSSEHARIYKLRYNPMADVEKPRYRVSTSIEVFSVEEIWALVRAAESEQDAAIFLTAAFTGLRRGELIALRWRDGDFTAGRVRVCGSFAGARRTSPKSGRVRSVPMPTSRRRCATSTTSSAPTRSSSSPKRSHSSPARRPALPRASPGVRTGCEGGGFALLLMPARDVGGAHVVARAVEKISLRLPRPLPAA